jgi:hypothetical protein
MRTLSKIPLLGVALLAAGTDAYADVTFHGFGQVVMGTTFSNNRSTPSVSPSASYHADPTFTPNSNFGLQATAPLSNNISATAQILAKGEEDFQPKFQWAYLKYQFNDTYALKVGRLQLPYYQYSDYEFVGEAYPWVLPPESVYFSSSSFYDGVNFSAQKSVGDWFLYMQAVYGNSQFTTSSTSQGSQFSVTATSHNIFGLTLEGDYNDWLNLRAAVFSTNASVVGDGTAANPFTQVDNAIASLNAQGATDAAKALAASNDPGMYYTASAQITRNNWLVLAEYRGFMPIAGASGMGSAEIASEYISLGYRFGKLLPLLTFGHEDSKMSANKMKSSAPATAYVPEDITINGTTIPNVHVPFDNFVDGLAGNPALRLKDYYYEFTLRYDLTATVALKLDYTYYQTHYKASDYYDIPQLAAFGQPIPTAPPDANRLLAAITFSF